MFTINFRGWIKWCGRTGLGLLLLASCTKSGYPPVKALPAIRQYIGQDTSLSLFQLALHRSGVDSVLSTGGPFTVFAPVNSAFLASGLTADKINSYDPKALAAIVGYHVLLGRIGSATLQGFTTDSVASLNARYQPLVALNYYGLFINGIIVTEGNIAMGDGILHKIGQVAFPPVGNLLQTLDSLPNTKMASYIFHQSPMLAALATDPAPLFQPLVPGQPRYELSYYGNVFNTCTLMVPSDDAFAAYGIFSIADLAALDTITRTTFIANTTIMGVYFTSDFAGGRSVGGSYGNSTYPYSAGTGKVPLPVLAGMGAGYYDGVNPNPVGYNLSATIGLYEFANDGLSIIGAGTQTPPQIIQGNIVASVGVIHILNQIFTANGSYIPGGKYPPQ